MIEVTSLRKSYGSLVAVDGISFTVADGETFGLLGPNGAGKTTTLHMLTGALAPDGGAVAISGHHDPGRPAVRCHIGLAPQSLALYDNLTAEENLAFFGRLYGLRGAKLRQRLAYSLDLSGLTERRRDLVNTYSGGMKRRLNLRRHADAVCDPAGRRRRGFQHWRVVAEEAGRLIAAVEGGGLRRRWSGVDKGSLGGLRHDIER